MKHPTLRIKKGSRSYDDREAREADERAAERREERRAYREKRRGVLSFLRMRPGSLLPVLILVLIALVILRTLPRSVSYRADIGGWHAALQARGFDNTLFVGVGFTRRGGREGALASVLFTLPDTGEQAEAAGVLEGSRYALRTRMRSTGLEKVLRAIVTVDGQSRTLTLSLPGP